MLLCICSMTTVKLLAGWEQNSAGSGTAPMPALHGETGRPKWLLSNLFSVVFAYLFPSSQQTDNGELNTCCAVTGLAQEQQPVTSKDTLTWMSFTGDRAQAPGYIIKLDEAVTSSLAPDHLSHNTHTKRTVFFGSLDLRYGR